MLPPHGAWVTEATRNYAEKSSGAGKCCHLTESGYTTEANPSPETKCLLPCRCQVNDHAFHVFSHSCKHVDHYELEHADYLITSTHHYVAFQN